MQTAINNPELSKALYDELFVMTGISVISVNGPVFSIHTSEDFEPRRVSGIAVEVQEYMANAIIPTNIPGIDEEVMTAKRLLSLTATNVMKDAVRYVTNAAVELGPIKRTTFKRTLAKIFRLTDKVNKKQAQEELQHMLHAALRHGCRKPIVYVSHYTMSNADSNLLKTLVSMSGLRILHVDGPLLMVIDPDAFKFYHYEQLLQTTVVPETFGKKMGIMTRTTVFKCTNNPFAIIKTTETVDMPWYARMFGL